MILILMGDTIQYLKTEDRMDDLMKYDSMLGEPRTTNKGTHYLKYILDDD